jgi:calcineurin-like phosphoesterase family protein
MAIQVTEKKKEVKMPKGVDVLFNFAIVLFIAVGVAYFFSLYLNVKAEETKEEIKQRIEAKKAEIPEKAELEKTAQKYFHLIEDFKLVGDNQKRFSLFFEPFERMIHPEVSISEISFNFNEKEATMIGEGRELVSIGQQFYALKKNEDVSDVNLTSLIISGEETEKSVIFVFSIKLNKDIFKPKTDD